MSQFDLVVIGTGTAGSATARRCRKAGWRVAVVDDQPYGGTCSLRGCDPKKVLVGAAELVDWQWRMSGWGVSGEARIDWPSLMRFKRTFTDPVPARVEAAFREAGIATYQGHARFVNDRQLFVGDVTLDAEHVVIATGARPAPLGIAGENHVRTSTDFLDLTELPRRIAFIGAGYVSFELAHVARRAGAEVTMFARGTPLKRFDSDVVAHLVDRTRAIGVDLRLETTVTAVERADACYRVHSTSSRGEDAIDTDLVVHGAGRLPNTKALDLASGSITADEHGAVSVNRFLQSVSNERVYAAGDAVLPPGSLPLTPVGAHEGFVVASNLLGGNTTEPDYRGIPSVVFTVPPLAGVGLMEAAARAQGLRVDVEMQDAGNWYTNRRVRESAGAYKIVVEEGSNRVLGAHLLGPNADEAINLFALAIRHGITASELKRTIYAYPTRASDIPYML